VCVLCFIYALSETGNLSKSALFLGSALLQRRGVVFCHRDGQKTTGKYQLNAPIRGASLALRLTTFFSGNGQQSLQPNAAG